MIKHAGLEKTGGLSADELVDIENILLKSKIDEDSFEIVGNALRYAYKYQKDGTNIKVVFDEFNDGKKIFDFYNDRNFIDYKDAKLSSNNLTQNGIFDEILPHQSQKVNEQIQKITT